MSIYSLQKRIEMTGAPVALELNPAFCNVKELISTENTSLRQQKIFDFNRRVIDATCERTAAYVINPADFDIFDIEVRNMIAKTAMYAMQSGAFFVFDCKYSSYSNAAAKLFELTNEYDENYPAFSPDAMTLNPYLGERHMQPFVFSANRTSKVLFLFLNPQDRYGCDGFCNSTEELAGQAMGISQYSNIGIALDTDDYDAVWHLRNRLKNCFIFTRAKRITPNIKNFFNGDGSGALLTFNCYSTISSSATMEKELVRELERIKRAIERTLYRKSKMIKI